jgi:hypothetical protein
MLAQHFNFRIENVFKWVKIRVIRSYPRRLSGRTINLETIGERTFASTGSRIASDMERTVENIAYRRMKRKLEKVSSHMCSKEINLH